ncbi:MAG: glycosyltransferase family 1 protein [Longicatena sp.]
MIRILQVVNTMNRAGLETMLMNYYRHIDKTEIQFDFLTHRPDRGDYDNEIEEMGGKIYYAPRLYPKNYPNYFRWMKKFFADHPEYRIIHSHIDAMSFLPLLAAKKSKIPVRIAHSHSTSIDKDYKYFLKQFFRSRINHISTNRLACGDDAGLFLFKGKSFCIIPNAVDASNFFFNDQIRLKKRRELSVTDEFVVAHVGRFYYPKNHMFLVEIFKEIIKFEPKALLLLVGTGEKENEVVQYVSELDLNKNVRFLGNRDDVAELYQAMDVLVLPSLFEGVPLVGIEAQFADLPCFFSNKVPKEVKFIEKTKFISLDASAEKWARDIVATKRTLSKRDKIENKYCKFDIKVSYKILVDYYLSLENNFEKGSLQWN